MSMATIYIFVGILYIVFLLAFISLGIYLVFLVIKALRKYIYSKDVREEKKEVRQSLAEIIKANRIRCKMTQEFVSEAIGVSRQACFSDVPVYCGRKFSLYKQPEKVPVAAAACQLGDDLPDNGFIHACAKS